MPTTLKIKLRIVKSSSIIVEGNYPEDNQDSNILTSRSMPEVKILADFKILALVILFKFLSACLF